MSRINQTRPGQPGYRRPTADAERVKAASGLNIIAAIWLIAAPFLLGYFELFLAACNDIVVGLLILAVASARFWSTPRLTAGLGWTNVVLGLWLVAAPFVLGYSGFARPRWNDVLVGLIVATLAAWSAMSTPQRTTAG